VEDQDGVELVGACVADEALEVIALLDAPSALQVHVLVDEREAVFTGVSRDGLALAFGRETLALFLGGLAHVCDGSSLRDRSAIRLARESRRQGDHLRRFFGHASS
jgi:hypothetical protein